MFTRFISMLTVLVAGCIAAAPTTQPVQQASDWGPEVDGLRARLLAPAKIEQNVALSVSIELQCDPASLPPGVARFDRSHSDQRLRLTLTNAATGRVVELKPFDMGLLLARDVHENTEPLDGRPLETVRAECLLREARDAITPGAYDCVVRYADSGKDESTDRPQRKDVWSGELHTAAMRIRVNPEVLHPMTLLVPSRLRLTRDLLVMPEDAERITAKLGNGMYVGTSIICSVGSKEMFEALNGGPPMQGGPNPIDDWHHWLDSHPEATTAEYTIEVFATADPPHHMWEPGPGANDYVTLWRKQFVVRQETPRE